MPSFIADILQELGWTDGTLIPVASEENKQLEYLLDQRNKELSKLRSETEAINIKQNELEQHKNNLLSEHRENMLLLQIHKEQNKNEGHLVKVSITEFGKLKHDADEADKEIKELEERGARMQSEIIRVDNRLKKKGKELGDDTEAIKEWHIMLKREENYIGTIEKFSKGDAHQVEVIDDKRRRLKLEVDKKQIALANLSADLLSEEKSAERICNQVSELLSQRRHIISTWSEAVRHLRERDNDITRMKVELELQRAYARQRDEILKDKTNFLEEQYRNNVEAERDLERNKNLLSTARRRQLELGEFVKTLNSEALCLKRQLVSTAIQLSNCRMDNKRLMKEKEVKENILQNLRDQIENCKLKLKDLMDTTKTSEQRMKQLEEMLRNEEKYMKQVIQENEKLQQCVFKSQQNLTELLNKERIVKLARKGYKLSMVQAEVKQAKILKDLALQDEILYKVSYTLLTVIKRIERIEGSRVDPEEERQLEARRVVLEAAKAERERACRELRLQLVSLEGDERYLIKVLAIEREQLEILSNKVMKLGSAAEGASREMFNLKKDCRVRRAEEAALALRTQHADRACKQMEDRSLALEKAVLGLKTAVQERCAEVEERTALLMGQKRCLQEELSLLNGDINHEKLQVEQLKSKYEVYLSALGRDESGEPLSLTYFKLKSAQEKNELQEQGDALDISIRKSETEIAALEATLQVLDTANRNFGRSLGTAEEEDPEMQEAQMLAEEINELREQRKKFVAQCRNLEQIVEGLRTNAESLEPKEETLKNIENSLLDEVAKIQSNIEEQYDKINRADTCQNTSRVKARRRIKDRDLMEAYRADIDCRMVGEANRSAVTQLRALEGVNLEENAAKWGVNLSTVHSATSISKHFTLSNASDKGSTLQLDSPCSSSSESSHIRTQLLAVRTVRSPLSSKGSVQSSSEKSPKSLRQSSGCMLIEGSSTLGLMSRSVLKEPYKRLIGANTVNTSGCLSMGVINLDLDLEPVKESPSLVLMRKNVMKKMYSSSSQSSSSKRCQSSVMLLDPLYRSVILNLSSIEPQGFGESVLEVR